MGVDAHTVTLSEMARRGVALRHETVERTHAMWALLALTVAGAVLRASTVNSRGLWQDEIAQIGQFSGTVWETIQSQIGGTHPPLFHLFMHFWIDAFGTGEVALRMFAVLVGVISIPVAYWAGATLYRRGIGLIAAGVLAFSPYHIWYSQEARMYSMLMLFGLLSLTCFVRALRTGTTSAWLAYFFATLGGLFTQYFFLLLLGGQVLYYFFVEILWREERLARTGERRSTWRKPLLLFRDVPTLAPWLISNVTLASCVLFWMYFAVFFTPTGSSTMVTSLTSTGLGYGAPGPSFAWRFNDVAQTLVEVVTGFHPPWILYGFVAMWPLLIYMVMLLLGGRRNTRLQTVLLMFALFSGTGVIWTLGMWQGVVLLSRYLMAMGAAAVLLVAVAIDGIPLRIRKAVLPVLIVLALSAWINQSYDHASTGRYENREAVAYVARQFRSGDVVVYEPFYIDRTVRYYLPADIPNYGLPMFSEAGMFRDTKLLIGQDLDRVVGPSRRVWLVLGFQNVKDILATTRLTTAWLADNGYSVAEDRRYNKVRVMLYEGDGSRDSVFTFGEDR
jgi:uncharacterized membrane protein